MEPTASDIVVSAPQGNRGGSHKRRSAAELGIRLGLCNALAPVVSGLTTEQVRQRVGDTEGNVAQLRRDIGHVKGRRVSEIGISRLLLFCERLNVDPWSALAAAAPRRLAS